MQETIGRPMEILLIEDNLSDCAAGDRIAPRRTDQAPLDLDLRRPRGLRISDPGRAFCPGSPARSDLARFGVAEEERPRAVGRDQARRELRSIPVVVLTASRIHEEILRAEHLQVESYITKPLALDKFLDVVRELRRFWLADMIVPTA